MKSLEFRLAGSKTKASIPAVLASDGLMLLAGYLALAASETSSNILFIEEPENGLHPQRLGERLAAGVASLPFVTEVRGRGLMLGFDLEQGAIYAPTARMVLNTASKPSKSGSASSRRQPSVSNTRR